MQDCLALPLRHEKVSRPCEVRPWKTRKIVVQMKAVCVGEPGNHPIRNEQEARTPFNNSVEIVTVDIYLTYPERARSKNTVQ